MSNIRVVLLTIVAVLATEPAFPADAQLLPLPFPTKTPKPTATRTATPVVTRTATRTPTPRATPAGALPDMTAEIRDVQLQLNTTVATGDVAEGCAEALSGVDLLRFSALSKNVGSADLVLGDPQCPTPCSDHPLEVCGNPDYVCSPAAGHNHPHYSNYARYELLDQTGSVVVVGHKQGYCLRDTNCASPVYTCTNQGISAGCYDTYDWSLGCQYLDVTDVPAGSYLLRVTIDPLHKIPEVSDDNNVVQKGVTITRPGGATPVRTTTATPVRTGTATPVRTLTATPQRTATALATPAPTTTPPPRTATAPVTPSVSRTPTPRATDGVPLATPTAGPVDPDGRLAATCQRAILQAGRTLLGRVLAGLDDCGAAVAACDGSRRAAPGCGERAADACAGSAVRVGSARAAFADRVAARCAALGDGGLLAASGLAFGRRADACRSEYGGGLTDVAAIASCVGRQHVCGAGGLVETEDPRAGARLVQGGLTDAQLCVADLGGGDPGLPELTDARALDGCSRAVRRAARRFIRHRLAALQGCLAARAGCLKKSTEREECERRATEGCAVRVARLAADPPRFAAVIERGCAEIDFALARDPNGGNVAALAGRCAALGVPELRSLADWESCLARAHACAVDDVVRYEAPRAAEWLGRWPAPGGGCPGAAD